MNLIKLKTRGLGTTPETHWLDIGKGLTLFHLPGPETARAFIKAIQTINPPYQCRTKKPYSDMPTTIRVNGHTRIIKSQKRTVALGVFTSTPPLVEQLASCSPLFYETDRIEVGRRLDYSRWINFIELASSTRWSEISEEIKELYYTWGSDSGRCEKNSSFIEQLLPTDRIQNVLMEQLDQLLGDLHSRVPENRLERLHELAGMVERARHFDAARQIIKKRLPFFIIIDPCQPLIERIELADSASPEVNLQPVEFLLQRLHRRSAGKPGISDQGSRLLGAVNRELLRLQAKQVIRFEPGDSSYHIEGGYRNRGITDKDSIAFSHALKEHGLIIIAAAKVLTGSPPILLFHQTAASISAASTENISRVIIELAAHCQCLAVIQDKALRQLSRVALYHYFDDFVVKRGVS